MTNILMCNQCGSRNHKDNRFCIKCGNTLSESAVIMDEIEYFRRHPRKNDEPEIHEYKNYPALKIISGIFMVLGGFTVIANVILLVLCIMGFFSFDVVDNYERSLLLAIFEQIPPFVSSAVAFTIFVYGVIVGLFIIAAGESINLFIDLQENADRQSILLTLMYYQSKKGKQNDSNAIGTNK